jgi:UDP-N-acetylglucosamine 2-epimerase (non-hydrolysing)
LVVLGDLISTMAASFAARKLGVKVAHVEAGIRSVDWSMPDEINRVVTDRITNCYFTTSELAVQNLIDEGVNSNHIFFVGNTMIDTLAANISKLKQPSCWNDFNLSESSYLVLTLHRPSNVDNPIQLEALFYKIMKESGNLPIIFPVHPRTKKNLEAFGISEDRLKLLNPMSYLEFNYLVKHAKGVITDSGGITEETTFMGIPCITLRKNTERPETVTMGTNVLLGEDDEEFKRAMQDMLCDNWKASSIPPLWDGKAAERIVAILLKQYLIQI